MRANWGYRTFRSVKLRVFSVGRAEELGTGTGHRCVVCVGQLSQLCYVSPWLPLAFKLFLRLDFTFCHGFVLIDSLHYH